MKNVQIFLLHHKIKVIMFIQFGIDRYFSAAAEQVRFCIRFTRIVLDAAVVKIVFTNSVFLKEG